MKCIICDRCRKVIENPKRARVVTCARPFRLRPECEDRPSYHGNDPKMNDILWERELCENCLDDLEDFLESSPEPENPTEPDVPTEPENPDEGEDSGENTSGGSVNGSGSDVDG